MASLMAGGGPSGTTSVTRNVEPRDGSLETLIPPPILSARPLQMASPSPVPPKRRVVEGSTWLKLSKRRSSRSFGMPIPVSRTTISTFRFPFAVGCEDARRTISPQGVNFTAFDRRFRRICRTRVTSPSSVEGTEGSMRKERSRPLAAAAGATRSKESSTASRREKGRLSSSSRSDSIFEKSRTSFRSVRRVSPLVRIVST